MNHPSGITPTRYFVVMFGEPSDVLIYAEVGKARLAARALRERFPASTTIIIAGRLMDEP